MMIDKKQIIEVTNVVDRADMENQQLDMEIRTKSINCIYCGEESDNETMISNVCKDCYLK